MIRRVKDLVDDVKNVADVKNGGCSAVVSESGRCWFADAGRAAGSDLQQH